MTAAELPASKKGVVGFAAIAFSVALSFLLATLRGVQRRSDRGVTTQALPQPLHRIDPG